MTAFLVIDNDPVRAEELCLLLRFMEDHPVARAEFSNWRTVAESHTDLRGIFLGWCDGDDQQSSATIQEIRAAAPQVELILVEEGGRPSRLPASIEASCNARLSRPFRYPQLSQLLAKLRQRNNRDHRNPQPHRNAELFRSLVGHSSAVARVRNLIQRVAPSEATVLILGESGTGKEVAARNIHYLSHRSHGPFVPINCGAIPDNLLESELFGHEKGAFTGAIATRRGRFELAQGGTLFLDEIGDMPLNMQVKLLRVLQEHTFERIGSDRSLTADVRIIAATHRNLEELIKTGQFREDLYYRLNVFPIEMPALRERIDDLSLLIEDLCERAAHEQGVRLRLDAGAMHCLKHYSWPGNVRELANLMERLTILQPDGLIELNDLPSRFRAHYPAEPVEVEPIEPIVVPVMDSPITPRPPGEPVSLPADGLDLRQYIMDLESSLIQSALDDANGVVAHAASLLKMRRTTLVEKMRKYSIKRLDDGE